MSDKGVIALYTEAFNLDSRQDILNSKMRAPKTLVLTYAIFCGLM